jgi:phospho-N-acetylmuramoyl-pentapeptide-transferase
MTLFTFNLIRLLIISALTTTFALLWAPCLIKILKKNKFWKKREQLKTITNTEATVLKSLRKAGISKTPRGGGLLIWISVLLIISLSFIISKIPAVWWFEKVSFLSRSETWLPLFALIVGSLIGFIDDFLTVQDKGKYVRGGMSFTKRMIAIILIGLIGGWWFYAKLERTTIHIPLIYNFPEGIDLFIGYWYIPLFVIVMLASWATGVVDGLDGLSGGVFTSIFGAFTIISLAQGKADLATFCAVLSGSLLAFLWFNIPPAKFYMGETGMMGLTSVMTVVAFLTDSVVILPIIGGVLIMEVGSIIIQLLSKKFRGKKIWKCTPIHHHFESLGWPKHSITMRFWILSVIFAILGAAIRLVG